MTRSGLKTPRQLQLELPLQRKKNKGRSKMNIRKIGLSLTLAGICAGAAVAVPAVAQVRRCDSPIIRSGIKQECRNSNFQFDANSVARTNISNRVLVRPAALRGIVTDGRDINQGRISGCSRDNLVLNTTLTRSTGCARVEHHQTFGLLR